MPVAIGNELKLQNNKVSAEYDNLFRKLNVAKAWTNSTYTVYTTKNPLVDDKTYSDLNLTESSTITAVASDGLTITDEYRTYDRDTSKDTSFNSIPEATNHETVTVADILRATE